MFCICVEIMSVSRVRKCQNAVKSGVTVWNDHTDIVYFWCLLFAFCLRLVWKHLLSSNSFPYFCRQEERKNYRLYEARREKVNKNYCIGLPLKSQKQKLGANFLESVRQIHLWLMWKAGVILISITVVRISLKSQVAVWKGCECKDASFSLTSLGAETMEISQEMLLSLTHHFS